MLSLFLNILPFAGLRSVFITLAHSLWLGTIMALLAGIIIIVTRRSDSLVRYKLLTGLLMLFVMSILYIFFSTLAGTAKTQNSGNIITVSTKAPVQETEYIHQQKSIVIFLFRVIEKYADTIVSIWFIVICFNCTRLISGLHALHRLKKINTTEAGTFWVRRMNELAEKIGIVKKIALFQSPFTKIPMVIGFLKPVILFPIGMLNALPMSEVEAILLHELAHIRRNDFLINLLQLFTEIFFFFNPGVLWVSSLIKNERENCCDDIALAITGDKKIFIHALVAFQEYNAGVAYATTFPGTKNHLLNRVKRIITNNNKTLNNMEKLILASGILITCLAGPAFSPGYTGNNSEIKKTKHASVITTRAVNPAIKETKLTRNSNAAFPKNNYNKKARQQDIIAEDTTKKIHYSGLIDGKKIRLTEENNKIKELYVDGKKIPEDQYNRYTDMLDKIHLDMKENAAKINAGSDLFKQEQKEIEQQYMLAMEEANEMKKQDGLMKKELYIDGQEILKDQYEKYKVITEKIHPDMKENTAKIKAGSDLFKQEKKETEQQYMLAIKEANKMKNQDGLMKKELYKQHELLKQKHVEMQKEMTFLHKKNKEVMKADWLKARTDLEKQQKPLRQKQVELQKQAEKMKLQHLEFKRMMHDSVRAIKLSDIKPVAYSGYVAPVNNVVVSKAVMPVKVEVAVKSVTSVKPAN